MSTSTYTDDSTASVQGLDAYRESLSMSKLAYFGTYFITLNLLFLFLFRFSKVCVTYVFEYILHFKMMVTTRNMAVMLRNVVP